VKACPLVHHYRLPPAAWKPGPGEATTRKREASPRRKWEGDYKHDANGGVGPEGMGFGLDDQEHEEGKRLWGRITRAKKIKKFREVFDNTPGEGYSINGGRGEKKFLISPQFVSRVRG